MPNLRHVLAVLTAMTAVTSTIPHAQAASGACLFLRNTEKHPVILELPRDAEGTWQFAEKGEDGDRGWVMKNGYGVRVDESSILRFTYQGKTTDIRVKDISDKVTAYTWTSRDSMYVWVKGEGWQYSSNNIDHPSDCDWAWVVRF